MNGFVGNPSLERWQMVHDAMHLGFGEKLAQEGLASGEVVCTEYIPHELNPEGVTKIDLHDLRGGKRIIGLFSPVYGDECPMYLVEMDDEEFTTLRVPVVARVAVGFLQPQNISAERLLTTKIMRFHYTEEATLVEFDEELQLQPVIGKFDSNEFRFTEEQATAHTRIDELASLAIEHI